MIIARTVAEVRAELRPLRLAGRRIGFVPTMGALHEGHLSLVRAARQACDYVVVSIFVNPLQFGPREDFHTYPRDEPADLAVAGQHRVDMVFSPSVDEMYPDRSTTTVAVGTIGDVLEGEVRPGHFAGVVTVVAKLFNIVEPQVAFFGRKDAQQVAVVRRMVTDLSFDVEIVTCPTVRAPDGLALSSRNSYLSREERTRAAVIQRALGAGERVLRTAGSREEAEKRMWDVLISEEGVDPDYAAAVDPSSFGPPGPHGPILLAVAGRVGPTRLIDNVLVEVPEER
jgi:pantoate--beta-alanine ligase